jgi:2-methylcitrate dehydratase PrpD
MPEEDAATNEMAAELNSLTARYADYADFLEKNAPPPADPTPSIPRRRLAP